MADEGVDEIKVFRKADTDQVEDDGDDGSDQLYADKQDVATECEEEESAMTTNHVFPSLGVPSAFSAISPQMSYAAAAMSPAYNLFQNMSLLSPSFPFPYNMMAAQNQQFLNSFKPQNPFPSSTSSPHVAVASSSPGPIRTPKILKENRRDEKKQKPIIKKPLNAYMIFMKENRHIVLGEEGNSSKQSAEINAILGKRWQKLTEEDQKIYFEKANQEKEEHARKYPGWSARDNYAIHKKKKVTRRVERNNENSDSKKCRARFGIEHQEQWCRHCKRKKKCLNVDHDGSDISDDSPPTPGSGGDLPDVKPHSLSSTMSSAASPSLSATMSAATQQMQNFMQAGMGFSPFGFNINAMSNFPFQSLMAYSNAAAAAAAMNQSPIIHPSSMPQLQSTPTPTSNGIRQDDGGVLRSSNSNDSVKTEPESHQ